jgi:glycosyltransferase involved in cell wall biosynthesis
MVYIAPIPYTDKSNPFLDLMYGAMEKQHAGRVTIVRERSLSRILWRCRGVASLTIIHIHWPTTLYGSRYMLKSLLRIWYSVALLTIARVVGMHILWTVHNKSAHEYPHPWIDVIGTMFISRLTNAAITHQRSYVPVLRSRYPYLKVFWIPFPNLIGVFGPIAAGEALIRGALGIEESDIVVGAIGSVRHYKGIHHVLKVFLRHNVALHNVKFLIAGGCAPEYRNELEVTAGSDRRVTMKLSWVPDSEMPAMYAACDYTIYWPDDSVLNSSAMMLSLSYGIPIITKSCYASDIVLEGVNGYTFQDEQELVELLRRLPELPRLKLEDVIGTVAGQTSKRATSETYAICDSLIRNARHDNN